MQSVYQAKIFEKKTHTAKLCIYFLILISKLLSYQIWFYHAKNAKISVL
jgi:hypothetical protein